MAMETTYGNRAVNLNLMTDWGIDLEVSEIAEMRKQQTEWYRKGIGYGYRMRFVLPMTITWYRCIFCGKPVAEFGEEIVMCSECYNKSCDEG